MDDTISRQIVINGLDYVITELDKLIEEDPLNKDEYHHTKKQVEEIKNGVQNLLPAQPEWKTGYWIPYDQRFPWSNDYKCSECGSYLNFSGVNGGRGDANFCPSCGADMRGK